MVSRWLGNLTQGVDLSRHNTKYLCRTHRLNIGSVTRNRRILNLYSFCNFLEMPAERSLDSAIRKLEGFPRHSASIRRFLLVHAVLIQTVFEQDDENAIYKVIDIILDATTLDDLISVSMRSLRSAEAKAEITVQPESASFHETVLRLISGNLQDVIHHTRVVQLVRSKFPTMLSKTIQVLSRPAAIEPTTHALMQSMVLYLVNILHNWGFEKEL